MLAASKVKMSGSEKNKSERNTYNISSIKRVMRGSTRACVELRYKEDLKTTISIACVQTSPISFVPRATKEIGDVCTQATISREIICWKPFHNILDYTELLNCMKTTSLT